MTDREQIEHVKAGGTVEVDDQSEALELCKAVKRETPATMRKIEEGTWVVELVDGNPWGEQ